MTLIWGTNYSIVKSAFGEIHPQAFNAVRMTMGSAVFLAVIGGAHRRRTRRPVPRGTGALADIFHTPAALTGGDWLGLVALAVVGHALYQFLFIGGLARTSVANSSLLLAATPVLIAFVSAALGQERITRLHWAGAVLSMGGIYIVIGHGARFTASGLTGDLMMLGAVCCWAAYTIGARRLMVRHSPVGVTGLSMAIGTLLYLPFAWGEVRRVDWAGVSGASWLALLYSSLFALCVAYTIWYAAVRQIGSARTSVYSNLVPLVAMAAAVAFLGEQLSPAKVVGAGAVLIGVALTRVGLPHGIPSRE